MVTSTQSCILLHTRAHTSKHDWSRHACLSKKITTIPHHTHARTPTHTAKAGLEHAHCDCKKTRVGKATHTICEQRRVGARNVCPPQHICSYSHRRPTGGELQCHTHVHTNTHKYRRVSTAVLHAAKTRLVLPCARVVSALCCTPCEWFVCCGASLRDASHSIHGVHACCVCEIVLLSFSPVALCFPWALVHLPRPCDGTMGGLPPTSALSFQLSS